MVNQQLRDYISEQIHLGVATEAVKSALLESGWAEADVNEAMQLESTSGSAPATAQISKPAVSQQPVIATKPAQINVPATADIVQPKITVTAKASAPATVAFGSGSAIQQNAVSSSVKPNSEGITAGLAMNAKSAHASRVPLIVVTILLLGVSTIAVFFYMKMGSLRAQIDTAGVQGGTAQSKLAGLTKERDTLMNQAEVTSAENKDLMAHLSLFVVSGGATGDQAISLSGTLIAPNSKGLFTLKTSRGAVATIKNSKDGLVDKTLRPLEGKSVQISGMHSAGSSEITVLTVNGASVQPVATSTPASTSTSTSTPIPTSTSTSSST
jgi:hypothetical protein